jgi:hypothetical protein
MQWLSSRSRILRWLTPPADAAARRLVVAGVAGILLTAPLSMQRLVEHSLPAGYALTAAGAVLAVRCCMRAWRPSSRITVAATLVCVVFASVTVADGIGQVGSAIGQTDAQLVCSNDVSAAVVTGGSEILHGQNVYTAYNVLRAERALGCAHFHVTPIRTGVFATTPSEPTDQQLDAAARTMLGGRGTNSIQLGFDYPAGSALAGLGGARALLLLNILFLIGAGVIVFLTSPRPVRRWVALALVAQTGTLLFIGQARPDGMVAALLLVACACRAPRVGGIALGLACAIKQTAWYMAPALLILAFRQGRGAGLRQVGVTAVVFTVINGPFVLAGPGAWFRGVLAPQLSPEFPLGGGPSGFFAAANIAAVVAVFTAISLLTVGAGWLMAWIGRGGWAEAGVIVASLALWDGPRSLGLYLGIIGLVAVGICSRQLHPDAATEGRQHAGASRGRLLVQPLT